MSKNEKKPIVKSTPVKKIMGVEETEFKKNNNLAGMTKKYSTLIAVLISIGLIVVVLSYIFSNKSANAEIQIRMDLVTSKTKNVGELEKIINENSGVKGCEWLMFTLANKYYDEMGNYDKAMEWYEKLLKSYPGNKFLCGLSKKRLSAAKEDKEWTAKYLDEKLNKLSSGVKPVVEVETEKGKFKIELFEKKAPNTTANFIKLIEDKAYDNTFIYDIDDEVIYCGGDDEKGSDNSDFTIKFEKTSLPNISLYVGMVIDSPNDAPNDKGNAEKSSNAISKRFYILKKDKNDWDGKTVIFGRVIGGLNMLNAAVEKNTKIKKIKIIKKRRAAYIPERSNK